MSRAMPPRLSVVVPTRDTRDLTMECLDSIQRSADRATLEVILVDDASSDGTTAAALDRWPGLRVLVNRRCVGFTVCANRGLADARGSILLLLNSDTAAEPEAVDELLAAFEHSPRLGIAGTTLVYPNGDRQWSHGRVPDLLWLFVLASGTGVLWGWLRDRLPRRGARAVRGRGHWRPVGWVTGAALAMRREVWERVGPLDEGFEFYAQDLDYCVRAASCGWWVGTVPASRIVHHHGATISAGRESTVAGQQPRLLWCDLLRWAKRHRGSAWARRAAFALRWGGRLRLLLRRLRGELLPRHRRAVWRAGSAALADAVRHLTPDPDATAEGHRS